MEGAREPIELDIREPGALPEEREVKLDLVRARIAYVSLGIFAVTLLLGFGGAYLTGPIKWQQVNGLLEVVIPVESLLIGGAVGFYFGSKT